MPPIPPEVKSNPYFLLVLGLLFGGGTGTVLSRPVFGGGLTREEVRALIKEELEANNMVLLQSVDLKLAQLQLGERNR